MPGDHPISGRHEGPDGGLSYFAKLRDLTNCLRLRMEGGRIVDARSYPEDLHAFDRVAPPSLG